jgi:hypothetical protein
VLRLKLNYFIPLISFLGLVFGVLLSKIAREEIRPGMKYLDGFKRAVLVSLIIVLLLNVDNLLFLFVGIIFGYLSSLYLEDYLYLGLACSLSFLFSVEMFFVLAVLVFLYGLPRGSLIKKFSEVYLSFLLFVIPLLLLFVSLKSDFVSLLIGLGCGGLFKVLIKRNFISL